MNKEEIEKNNKLIAKFMGNEPYEDSRYGTLWNNPASDGVHEKTSFSLKYNTSWDWLMPVIEKIEKMDYGFKMCRKVVEVYIDSTKETFIKTKESSRIESLFKAVVEFIELREKFTESQNK